MLPAILGGKPAFSKLLPISSPSLPPLRKVVSRLERVWASGWVTNGPFVAELESRAAEYFGGGGECVAVSNCTSGLILTLKALGVEGEVMVPSFTFFSTVHSLTWNGLKPVFADSEIDTFNIDPNFVEEHVTAHTGAIVAVSVFGNPPDMKRLAGIAAKRKIPLVFDSAHAMGALYKGRPCAFYGDAQVFSLSPSSLLTAGEGGLVATKHDELAEKIRSGRNCGNSGNYDPSFAGLNARMDEMSAALALEGLGKVEEDVLRRQTIVLRYRLGLMHLPGIHFQKVFSGDRCPHKEIGIRVRAGSFGLARDDLAGALRFENIETRPYFNPPVHKQRIYASDERFPLDAPLPNTEKLSSEVLCLPCHSHLKLGDVDKVCHAIERIHKSRRKMAAFGPVTVY